MWNDPILKSASGLPIVALAVLSGLTQAVSHWTGLPLYLVVAIAVLVVGVAAFLVRLRR